MPTKIKYIGTARRYFESAITGKQSVWQPGGLDERPDADAALLLATGLFQTIGAPGVAVGVPVAASKTLNSSDLEQILDVSAAATLTIPSDTVLGLAAGDRVSVGAYQQTSGAVTWAGSGSTLRGTAPTAAQYLVTGLLHVGANEWAYIV